jgi:hypothetical protein
MATSRIALATLVGFYPDVFNLTGPTFKSAFAQVRSGLNHADKPTLSRISSLRAV